MGSKLQVSYCAEQASCSMVLTAAQKLVHAAFKLYLRVWMRHLPHHQLLAAQITHLPGKHKARVHGCMGAS